MNPNGPLIGLDYDAAFSYMQEGKRFTNSVLQSKGFDYIKWCWATNQSLAVACCEINGMTEALFTAPVAGGVRQLKWDEYPK